MAPKPKFQFAFEEVVVSDDEDDQEDQEKELSENEFENFIQQSISFPEEDVAITPPIVTVRESDTLVQSSPPTPEHMDAHIVELHRTERKPPKTVHVDTKPPSGSDLEDSAHALLLRKRKSRDPRSGVLITDQVQKEPTPIEPRSMNQSIQSPFTESISMDQDFQRPIIEEEVIPTQGDQALRSSFESLELDISKGKSKLPEFELVDVVLLQNILFDLEQSSAEMDLIIGKHDTRISELEKENSIKIQRSHNFKQI
ncbi:unnamed protein product [Lactuca virosa]|uniref:Uncharacterized protein n=1 Tax=Lactuca virosa TaxID=75947 RepID=A0AAU9P0Z0_9ASTR|nr:unnamed protein product [Lactuca virosa]